MRSIQKGELGAAKQLLFKMRDALGNFEQCDNTESMVHMTIAALDIENRSKTKGMAPKNIRIEKS